MHYLDIGSQNNVHLIPSYSVTINRLASLQPAVCTYFIRSLLLFADVQTFCSEKESLFVTLESFKERETTQSLPVSPSVTIQPTKQTDPYLHVMQSTSNAAAVYSAHPWFCCYSWLFKQKSWKLCVLMRKTEKYYDNLLQYKAIISPDFNFKKKNRKEKVFSIRSCMHETIIATLETFHVLIM